MLHGGMLLMISMVNKSLDNFIKQKCKKKKKNQKEFRIRKVIKKTRNKLYVKWKRYDNLLNTRIDKKVLYKTESIFF